MARIPFATKRKSTSHAQNTTTTITMETEDSTEGGSDPDAVSTMTEDPTLSPLVSQTTEAAGTATTAEHSEETISKTGPKLRKREWRTRQPRDNSRTYRSAKEQIDGPCSIHG